MTKTQIEDYQDTEAIFWKESPGFKGNMEEALNQVHRAETTLHRIAENQCNGHPKEIVECRDGRFYKYNVEDEIWRLKDEKTELRLRVKIQSIADELGFKVTFNGDPRGGAIRFILPSGKSNNWDGETWGVYW